MYTSIVLYSVHIPKDHGRGEGRSKHVSMDQLPTYTDI